MNDLKGKMETAIGVSIPNTIWWRGMATIRNWLEDEFDYDTSDKISEYVATGSSDRIDDELEDELVEGYKGYFATIMGVAIKHESDEEPEPEEETESEEDSDEFK